MNARSNKVVVLLALLGIGGFVLNFGMMSYLRKGKGVNAVVNAEALARQALETLTINGYAAAYSGSDCVHGQYARMWTVDTYTDEKRVEVTVSWPKSKPRRVVRVSGSIPRVKAAPAQPPAPSQDTAQAEAPPKRLKNSPPAPAASPPAPRL